MSRRAILFTLLNPQTKEDCFCGFRAQVKFDLSGYRLLKLRVRGQGANTDYKVVLQHKGQNDEPYPTYENTFQAPSDKCDEVTLFLSDFAPYYRGRKLDHSAVMPLDMKDITSFEIRMFGGIYEPVKQGGVSALEIDWIKVL